MMSAKSKVFPTERNDFEMELRAAGSVSEYCRQKGRTRAAVHSAARSRGIRITKDFFYSATGPTARLCVSTHSGLLMFYASPNKDMVTLRDIAFHLAHTPRFNGDSPISVAEHSILVAKHVFDSTSQPSMALVGLLHDGHEAYLGDIVRPLKQFLGPKLKQLERRIDWAIADRFELRQYWEASRDFVRVADDELVAIEAATFGLDGRQWVNDHYEDRPYRWVPAGTKPQPKLFSSMTPDQAEQAFLVTFEQLQTATKTKQIKDRQEKQL
jgi:hypothetical protein